MKPWWREPVTVLLWREICAHGRTRRQLRALQDDVDALIADIEAAMIATCTEMRVAAEGWRERAVALYLIADPLSRDDVLGTLDSIDCLWVAERPTSPRAAP